MDHIFHSVETIYSSATVLSASVTSVSSLTSSVVVSTLSGGTASNAVVYHGPNGYPMSFMFVAEVPTSAWNASHAKTTVSILGSQFTGWTLIPEFLVYVSSGPAAVTAFATPYYLTIGNDSNQMGKITRPLTAANNTVIRLPYGLSNQTVLNKWILSGQSVLIVQSWPFQSDLDTIVRIVFRMLPP